MVLPEKGIGFEVHELDLSNKSEEFLSVSPYGKVPVLNVNGISLYESNIVNEYLDEVYDSPRLMPENPEERALVHSWMAFADDYFFPSSLLSIGFAWGCSEGIQKMRFKGLRRSSTMCSHVWSTNWRAGSIWWESTHWRTSPTPVTSNVYECWSRAARLV
jgi:hypothetical protein